MKFPAAHLLLAAVIVILFSACKEGNVYYTLENEVKVLDLSLPNDIIVFDFTKIGSSYYAAAGKIWTVSDSATEWDINATIDPPNADALCTALVASPFGTKDTLFGGFINGSGNLGLYESTAAPSFSGQAAITDPNVEGAQIALLKVQSNGTDYLVAVTARQPSAGADFQFGIVRSSDGASFTPFIFSGRPAGDEEKQINDVIYSATLGCWLATEGTELYSDEASPGTLEPITPSVVPDGEVLTGLFDDGTNVWVASTKGAVYYSPNGTSWTRIAADTISGTHPPLTRFAGPVDAGIILVGSDGYGYYLLNTAHLTRYATTTSDLYTASVRKIYFDDPLDRVFACTSRAGLWRGAVLGDGNGSIDWNQE